ncbi:MAG TPA: hypothetical protein VHE35_03585 [Kofleriaceae bacterium]|nr:hypothetical protein [Kofleriaceae bacterium]
MAARRDPPVMTRRPARSTVLALAIGVALAATAARATPAAGYPYFQLTSGNDTCSACHVSPSGGGPLTEWGRGESGDTLARGGDGAFLHGAVELPAWLDVGGDVRLAALVNDVGSANGAERALFPMQAELSVHAHGGGWHVIAAAGLLDAVRQAPVAATEQPAAPWLVSPAHYVLWRAGERGPYARAGKFATPYGLGLADHTTYVRRQPGLGLDEEPYAVSAGYLGAAWDVHATAFVSDPWRGPADREAGGAVKLERRLGPRVLQASARIGAAPDDVRARAGVSGGWWYAPASLLALVELDGGWEALPMGGRPQLTTYAGLAWLPARGVVAGTAYEHDDEDLAAGGDTRDALDLWSTFMPIAHVELGLSSRYQWIAGGGRAAMALFQVHYFL